MIFPKIYLASNSPRRSELLSQIAVEFNKLSLDIDETILQNESAETYVNRLAITKAQTGWQLLSTQEKRPVLGSDTAVVLDQTILGKPQDHDEAESMIQQLAGRDHQVMTAVALIFQQHVLTALSVNTVTFDALSQDQIAWYVSTNEGVDKAGAYAIQGQAAMFINHISGSYSGIMGLPLNETATLLSKMNELMNEQ